MIDLVMLVVLADGTRHAHATTPMQCVEWADAMSKGMIVAAGGENPDPSEVVVMAMCLPRDMALDFTNYKEKVGKAK